VRSILNKVRKAAQGGRPLLPVGSEREQLLASLYADLVRLRTELKMEMNEGVMELANRDWVLSLRTVENSIRLRTGGSGSREYLEFLKGFLARGEF
jgi:hypothetical protein